MAQGRGRLRFLPKEKRKLAHNHYVPLHSYYHDSTLFKSVKLGSDMVSSQGYGVFIYFLIFVRCTPIPHALSTNSVVQIREVQHRYTNFAHVFFQGLKSVYGLDKIVTK